MSENLIENNHTLIMLTGPRKLPTVFSSTFLENTLSGLLVGLKSVVPNLVALSGGAVGSDTIFARAAYKTGVPFILELPHLGYAQHYHTETSLNKLSEYALATQYTVKDGDFNLRMNFVRNASMVRQADYHIVVHEKNPNNIVKADKGGTAACVRDMQRLLPEGSPIFWINPHTSTIRTIKLEK